MAARGKQLIRALLALGLIALVGTLAYELVLHEQQRTLADLPYLARTGETPAPSVEGGGSSERAALPTATPPAADAQVLGRVVDEQGSPIQGCTVRLAELDLPQSSSLLAARATGMLRSEASTTTDAQGRFGFGSRGSGARAHLLAVEAEGFAPLERFVACLAEPQHDFGDLVLQAGGEIRGRVVDPQGGPVEGCELRWARTQNGQLVGWETGIVAGSSDAQGRFRLEHLPQGLLRVCADRERLSSDWSAPVSATAGASSAELEIVVEPAVLVRGSVHDAVSDAPLEARIVLFPHSGERFLCGTCAPDGSFKLWCRAASGSLTYGVSAPGHQGNDGGNGLYFPADGSDPAPLAIRLSPIAAIEFRVRDAASGQPLPGAELVWLSGTEVRAIRTGAPMIFGELGADARADAEGRIRIAPEEIGHWQAIVRAPAHEPRLCNSDELTHADAIVELSAGALLDVELRAEGQTLSGVAVELRPSVSAGNRRANRETASERDLRAPLERRATGADGKVRFDGLPAGSYSVQARGAQLCSEIVRDLELGAGAQRSVVLSVTPACSISGRVTGSAPGSAARRIVARDAAGRCYGAAADARGNFSVAGLPPGRYEVGLAWARTGLGRHTEALELHAGEQARRDLDAHLVSLRGRVLLNGEPAGRCTLSFYSRSDPADTQSREEWTACTDRDGRFELAVADDFPGRLLVDDRTGSLHTLALAVRELDPAAIEGELELAISTGAVEFECVERGSRAAVGWSQVQLQPDPTTGGVHGFQPGQTWSFILPDSGRVAVAALPVGNYRVTSSGPGGLRGEPASLCVRAAESAHLVIELARGQ